MFVQAKGNDYETNHLTWMLRCAGIEVTVGGGGGWGGSKKRGNSKGGGGGETGEITCFWVSLWALGINCCHSVEFTDVRIQLHWSLAHLKNNKQHNK